jgi:WD40 repeat protein
MVKRIPVLVLLFLSAVLVFPAGQPETVVQAGHTSPIECLSFSPNGEHIVSIADDNLLKLWTIDGDLVRNIGPSYYGMSLDFSPDGKSIASSSKNQVKIWSLSGDLIGEVETGLDNVKIVEFSPDGKHMAVVTENSFFLITSKGDVVRRFDGHSEKIHSVSFSPDGESIIAGLGKDSDDEPGAVKLWSLDGEVIRTFNGHSGPVTSVDFSPDGSHMVSGSIDETVKIWSVQGGLVRTLKLASPDFPLRGKAVFSEPVSCVAFSPDGKRVAASYPHTLKIWSVEGDLLHTLGHFDKDRDFWANRNWNALTFSPDGGHLAAAGGNEMFLWSADGKLAHIFESNIDRNECVTFSTDGRHFASGRYGEVHLWSQEDGLLERMHEEGADHIWSLAFAKEGRRIVCRVLHEEVNKMRIWSLDGKLTRIPDEYVSSVVVGPEGRHVVCSSSGGEIKLWSADGELIRAFGDYNGINVLAVGPKGRNVITGYSDFNSAKNRWEGFVDVWALDGKIVHESDKAPDYIHTVVFSPKGEHFVLGFKDSGTRLFSTVRAETLEGELIRAIGVQNRSNLCVVFSPDGRRLAFGTPDFSAVVQSLDGSESKTLHEHLFHISGVAFSPDGRFMASSSWDGTIKISDLRTEECLTLYALGTEDWIAVNRDGEFDCSDGGRRFLRFVSGIKVQKTETYWSRFHKPGLLLRFFRGEE